MGVFFFRVIITLYYEKGVTTMSTIKNAVVNLGVTLIAGAVSVIGMLAGFAIWNNGLGDKVEEKTRKLFKHE